MGRKILHPGTGWGGQLCSQLSSFCPRSSLRVTECFWHLLPKALHKIMSHICSEAEWKEESAVCSLLLFCHPGLSFWRLLQNRDVWGQLLPRSAPGRGYQFCLQKQGVQGTTEREHGKGRLRSHFLSECFSELRVQRFWVRPASKDTATIITAILFCNFFLAN